MHGIIICLTLENIQKFVSTMMNEKEAEQIVNFIFNNISLSNSSQMLNFAAGYESNSLLFAKLGRNVTVVYLSEKWNSI